MAFNRLRDSVRIPMYGCDCYAYGLLAAGHADLVVEADLKPYDYMALVPVVQVRRGRGEGGVRGWRRRCVGGEGVEARAGSRKAELDKTWRSC